jgi:PAS domain S-box-containing protein
MASATAGASPAWPEPLDERSQEVASLLQHVSIPSWIVDRDGVFVWTNNAFVVLFGDRRGEHYSPMVAPEHLETVREQFQRKLDGEPATDYEIEAVLTDGRHVPTEVSSVRLEPGLFCGAVFGMAQVRSEKPSLRLGRRLTPRQLEVLELLAGGASTDQIAAELGVTTHTVRNYVRQVLSSLQAHSRLEAVVTARRVGLLGD